MTETPHFGVTREYEIMFKLSLFVSPDKQSKIVFAT